MLLADKPPGVTHGGQLKVENVVTPDQAPGIGFPKGLGHNV